MEKKAKLLLTLSILILTVTALYLSTDWLSKVTGYNIGKESTALALCLKQQDVELYTSDYCADCVKQKELFTKATLKDIKQVDCGKDKELCPSIREIPAWYINKEIHYGIKTLGELKNLSECDTPSQNT